MYRRPAGTPVCIIKPECKLQKFLHASAEAMENAQVRSLGDVLSTPTRRFCLFATVL